MGILIFKKWQIKEIIIVFSDEFCYQLVMGGGEKVDIIVYLLGVNVLQKVMIIWVLNQFVLVIENDFDLVKMIIVVYDVQ